MRAVLLLLLPLVARAEDGDWLQRGGAGEYEWGTTNQPYGATPRPRDLFLPDSGYVGRQASDRPEDMEIPGPHPDGERRFLRYVDGRLVDAWVLREGPIDASGLASDGREEWTGAVLGPADDGYRAFGKATSWLVGNRTWLWWRDVGSDREVMVSRATSNGTYAVRHASRLEVGSPGTAHARLKGDLKEWLKPAEDPLSGCLNQAPKPVEATLWVEFDHTGHPARIRSTTDQPSPASVECFAGAVYELKAPPDTKGTLSIIRFQ